MSDPMEVEIVESWNPHDNGVRILSLDGGDARCVSLLLILQQLMHRLEYDHGRPVRPFQFFHSITGVGAGGVIAIFLGVLRMTVDEALNKFAGICDKVFAPNIPDNTSRSELLKEELKVILVDLNLRPDSLLENAARRDRCRVSICYSAAAIQQCMMFRNYKSREHSDNPTIIEAAVSSWAIRDLFPPILVGHPLLGVELMSAVELCNNPTREALHEARAIYGAGTPISTFLSLGSGRRAPLSAHSPNFHQRSAQQTEVTENAIEREFGLADGYYRFSPDHTIESDTFGAGNDQFASIMAYTRAYLRSAKTQHDMESYLKTSKILGTTYLTFLGEVEKGGF